MSKLPGNADQANSTSSNSADPRDQVANAIDAEIADHLATSSDRLLAQGLDAHAARKQSQEQFGDVAAISRRCYWIKQGDYLMFRTAVIILLVVLCLGLGVTAFSSLRTQQQMAQQMVVLAEQLKAVAQRQQPEAPLLAAKPSEPPPQEITGKAYIKQLSVPASKKEVLVLSANDGQIVRRVMTDDQGRYQSGPLAAGDYCLVTGVENAPRQTPFYPYLQSGPIYVYPGLPAPGHDLDVVQHAGRLSVELSRPLPRLEVEGKYTIESRLFIRVATDQSRHEPWTSSQKMPPNWPLPIMNVSASRDRVGASSRYFLELLNSDDLEQQRSRTHFGDGYGLLPFGKAAVAAAIIADVIPVGYERPELLFQDATTFGSVTGGPSFVVAKRFVDQDWHNAYDTAVRSGSGPVRDREFESVLKGDDFHWLTKGLGQIWLRQMKSSDMQSTPPKPYTYWQSWLTTNATNERLCEAPIQSDGLTRLRIEVPDDIAARIQALVARSLDPAEFAKFTLGDASPPPPEIQAEIANGNHPLFRKVKIAVLKTEPLQPSTP